jgi:dolichol-phosphate mannosyltransferase
MSPDVRQGRGRPSPDLGRFGVREFAGWVQTRSAAGGRFLAVGLLGIGVNQLLLWALVEGTHVNYLLAAIVASQGSTTFNFAGVELWVFGERRQRSGLLRRFLAFDALNASALLLRLPILFALTTGLRVHYLASNLLAIGLLTAIRFVFSDRLIWRFPHAEPGLSR